MMHSTSESDEASLTASSSTPNYFVQSPSSRDSHDETDKCSSANERSPSDSPSNPRSSLTSSSSTTGSRISGYRRRWNKHYCDVVREEGQGCGGGEYDDDDYYGIKAYARHCRRMVLLFAVGMVFVGTFLIVWGASRQYKAKVSIKSLVVHNMHLGQGSDYTGVPTRFLSLNCSANLTVSNPATFFGIHVSSPAASLLFSQVTVATGQVKKYYQPKRSRRSMWVSLVGQAVPLYGAGETFAASNGGGKGIPFSLELEIESRGYVVGQLINTKHRKHISCSLSITPHKTKVVDFQKNSCTFK